jgi:hypothetical protein
MESSVETFANETIPSAVASSSFMTCYKEFGRNLITGLMGAVIRVEHILNISNVPEKYLV